MDKAKRLQSQAQLKAAKLRLYEKYAADEISRETYLKAKAELDSKLAEAVYVYPGNRVEIEWRFSKPNGI